MRRAAAVDPLMRRHRSPIPPLAGSSRRFAVLFAATALLGLPTTASALSGDNLVVNGDAERPVGSEWTAVQGMGLESYAYGGTIPGGIVIGGGSYDGGTAALHPRGAGLNPPPASDPDVTINEQRIALSAEDAEAIDTGTVRARLSAYVGGTTNQADRIGAVAEWRDAGDEPIGVSLGLPEVDNVERGNQSGTILRIDEQAIPAGARSVVVRLTGTRVVPPFHNGYLDNLELRLIGTNARIEKAFGVEAATAGEPFRLTYTVRNSGDRTAKPAWSFSDVLPEGIRVAPVSRATTDCPASRFAVVDRRISLGGAVVAGQDACTAAIDVVAEPGRYASGAKQLDEIRELRVGSFTETQVVVEPGEPGPGEPGEPPVEEVPIELPPIEIPPFVPPPPAPPAPEPPPLPPTPPAPPVEPWLPSYVRPALRVTLRASGSGTRSEGDRVSLRLRVENPAEGTASRVRVCVNLPSALRAEPEATRRARGSKAKRRVARSRSTTRPCWTVGRLEGDADWSTTLTVRVVRNSGTTVRPRATATSPDVVARASSTAKLRIAGEETDEDTDARRR